MLGFGEKFRFSGAIALYVCALSLLDSPWVKADLAGFPTLDPSSLISDSVAQSITTLIGFGTQDRPYEPATALLKGSPVGLSVGLETTLVKIPEGFFESLASSGYSVPSTSLPSLPIPMIHIHKGFGEKVDFGGSFLWLNGNKVIGVDGKVVLAEGEEGPTWALRFCYTYSDLSMSGINISTKTFAPQLLVSRQLEFADPYLGIGLQYALGAIDANISADQIASVPAGVPVPDLGALRKDSSVFGGVGFGGLALKIPRAGIRVTIEMAYSTSGTSAMGLKTGFSL